MAYYSRGVIYLTLEEYDRAVQDYDRAIHLDPQLAIAYAGLALSYTALGNDEDAGEMAERAIELGLDPTTLNIGIAAY